ncbi:MAG: hypothetical protein K8T20_12170 [Planctomycetes bacterium]|nr:hypothetical protein [Planctomycetota bacterium]
MRPLLALLLLASAAFAGDAIDEALVNLGADDSGKRDSAEKALWAADGSAWERAKAVLAATKDPEVRVRLTPIVDWLAVQAKSAALEEAWKDRWFLVKESGVVTGVEHQQAVLETAGGVRTWKFTSEADAFDLGPEPDHLRLVCHARHDPDLTPVDAEWNSRSAKGLTHLKFSWSGGEVHIESLSLAMDEGGIAAGRTATMPLDFEPFEPYTLSTLAAERIERASLARIDSVRFMTHEFLSPAVRSVVPYEARLVDVAHLDIRGHSVEARHYLHESSPRTEYWISDREGLVRCLIDRMEMVLVDEATARAQGLDPASRRAKAAIASVEALTSAADAATRDQAELVVLATPGVFGLLREALAATADPDTKLRLERCQRWLDPAFAKAELTRLWADRYFKIESGASLIGAERMSATPADDPAGPALDWTGEGGITIGVGLLRSTWSARTRFDPYLSPIRAEFQFAEPRQMPTHWRAVWGEAGPEITLIEGGRAARRGLRGRRNGPPAESRMPPTLDSCLSALVERASLARLSSAVFQSHEVLPEELNSPQPYAIEFAGEEKLEFEGRSLAVRHYIHRAAQGRGLEEYWVSDAEGLVRMTYENCVVTAISREAWLTAGFDSASMQAKETGKLLASLRGDDELAQAGAMVALESDPDALPAIRVALAAEQNPAAKARLQSIADWHDPGFAREALAALGRERWFAWKKDGSPDGWIRFSGTPAGDGWEWKVSQDIPGNAFLGSIQGTFRVATPCLPRHVDLQIHVGGQGTDVDLTAALDGATLDISEVKEKGVAVEFGEEARQTLSGGDGRPVVPDVLVPRFLERASLARLDTVELCSWELSENDQVHIRRFSFRGEEKVRSLGRDVTARHYALQGGTLEYWITDEGGVIKGKRDEDEGEAVATEAEAKGEK